MTPEDNLERFFKNRLKEDSKLPEAEWSIPSDDIWEAAKVHFPKKKKKDRIIFFWFYLVVFCLCVLVGVVSFLSHKENLTTAKVIIDNKIITEPKQDKYKATQEVVATEKINATIKKEVIRKPLNKQRERNNLNKQQAHSLKAKNIPKGNELMLTKLNAVGKTGLDRQLKTAIIKVEKEQVDIPVSLTKLIPSPKITVLNSLKNSIAFLDIPERSLNLKVPLPTITEPVKPPLKKWEVGLSYAPFILIQESIINDGAESPFEEQSIGIKHQNINFSIRRYLHPRFSVSSGLYLSKGKLDLAFCDTRIHEESNPAILGYFLRQSNPANKINLVDLGLDMDASIEYVADANLNAGDSLTIKVGIPFNIKFVQMPLLLNAHFGKRKLKGILHTGISVDYQQTKANDLRVDIFKGADLISKPIVVEPLNEQSLKVRWQAGLGLRYAIKDFLQVGAGLHINITDPIFSRYDFGVYYGF